MVPLPGNQMAPTTQDLADQLATIVAKLDAILASLRDDIEEMRVHVNTDGWNSEESNQVLQNMVEEEPQGSERDALQPLGSGIGGGISDRKDVTGEVIEGANELNKIDGTGIEVWGVMKKLTENGSLDRKNREEFDVLVERNDKNNGIKIETWGAAKKLLANDSRDRKNRGEFDGLVEGIDKNNGIKIEAGGAVKKLPANGNHDRKGLGEIDAIIARLVWLPRIVLVFFIIVWDPGKENCRLIGSFDGPYTYSHVLNWNKFKDYNKPLQIDTAFDSKCYDQLCRF